jgi:hypothetical protein
MKNSKPLPIASPRAYFLGACLAAMPVAQAQQLAKNGLRIPYTIALTATSEIEGAPKEWTKNGISYTKETTKFDVFKVGNKQLLEVLLEQEIIEDGTISGWSLVEYLQTKGSSDDEGMFQQGIFLVKTGREPIDMNEYLGYTLTEREVESGEETYSENNGVYTETSKYNGQCIGKIQLADVNIGSGVAKYTDTWSGTWSEYDYEYNSTWSYVPQTFSISGISGWLGGESEDDDPYGEPDVETYYPSNPQADYLSYSTYDNATSGPRLYFYDSANNISYYGSVNFAGPFYNDQNDEQYIPSNPENHFQSVSSVSTNGGPSVYRFYFYNSTDGEQYYSNVQFVNLTYYREIYDEEDEEDEEDPVLIQGSIKSGKGTAIRLPEWADDYYPY